MVYRWCPCFFTYLLSTLPAIWLLQLSQYETFVNSQQQPGQSNSFLQPALLNNITTVNTITTRDLDNIGSSTASVPLSTESPFEVNRIKLTRLSESIIKIKMCTTVLPTESDSDVMFCLQSYFKTNKSFKQNLIAIFMPPKELWEA